MCVSKEYVHIPEWGKVKGSFQNKLLVLRFWYSTPCPAKNLFSSELPQQWFQKSELFCSWGHWPEKIRTPLPLSHINVQSLCPLVTPPGSPLIWHWNPYSSSCHYPLAITSYESFLPYYSLFIFQPTWGYYGHPSRKGAWLVTFIIEEGFQMTVFHIPISPLNSYVPDTAQGLRIPRWGRHKNSHEES